VWFAGWVRNGQHVYSYGLLQHLPLGSEIKDPERNIRAAFFFPCWGSPSCICDADEPPGVVPWREAQNSDFIASLFVERLYGQAAARFVTGMILWIAVASAFSVLLGASRVPIRRRRRNFFPVFGKVHATKHFPHVSLLVLAGLAFVFSISLKLKQAIAEFWP